MWVHDGTLVQFMVGGVDVRTTHDYSFWNATDQAWQWAGAFDEGDMVFTAYGDQLATSGNRPGMWTYGDAYNLTVDDIHTYFVIVGESDVLVHNTADPFDACSVAAQRILAGHAGGSHASDFAGMTDAHLAQWVDTVTRTGVPKNLEAGRTAYWLDDTVVILDPNNIDGGTVFKPDNGVAYFLGPR